MVENTLGRLLEHFRDRQKLIVEYDQSRFLLVIKCTWLSLKIEELDQKHWICFTFII